jgi:hypothetical protein
MDQPLTMTTDQPADLLPRPGPGLGQDRIDQPRGQAHPASGRVWDQGLRRLAEKNIPDCAEFPFVFKAWQ